MNGPPKNSTPPHSDQSLPIRLAGQVDKLCDEFRQELRAGGHPRIEDYLAKLPEAGHLAGLRELIAEELEHGREDGQHIDPQFATYAVRTQHPAQQQKGGIICCHKIKQAT